MRLARSISACYPVLEKSHRLHLQSPDPVDRRCFLIRRQSDQPRDAPVAVSISCPAMRNLLPALPLDLLRFRLSFGLTPLIPRLKSAPHRQKYCSHRHKLQVLEIHYRSNTLTVGARMSCGTPPNSFCSSLRSLAASQPISHICLPTQGLRDKTCNPEGRSWTV